MRDRSAGVGLHSGGSAGGTLGSELATMGHGRDWDTEDQGPGR